MITCIVLSIMFAMFVSVIMMELLCSKIDKCKHTHFAEYRSRKVKQCVDCGIESEIDKTDW